MNKSSSSEELLIQLQNEAREIMRTEPILSPLLQNTILNPNVTSFEDVISYTIANRLMKSCGANPELCQNNLVKVLQTAFASDYLELGWTMRDAVREDALAVLRRDPACDTLLEVVLFFKGFATLVVHRAAKRCWNDSSNRQRFVALWLQSQASAAFGVDIHPNATIGKEIMMDHATGIVIGETAVVGDGCTLLHGVTLGGTGKEIGDRHPKVGKNVLIGAGTSVLGNIKLGDGAKIGAGSVVIKPIPHGATAVGAPAKVVGWAKEEKPGSDLDNGLEHIQFAGVVSSPDDNDDDEDTSDDTATTTDTSTDDDDTTTEKTSSSASLVELPTKKSVKTPKTASNKNLIKKSIKKKLDSSLCPYQYFHESKAKDGVNLDTLNEILLQEGASADECGEIIFELLKANPDLGYIPTSVFVDKFYNIAKQYSKLDLSCLEKILQGDFHEKPSTEENQQEEQEDCKLKKFCQQLKGLKSKLKDNWPKPLIL